MPFLDLLLHKNMTPFALALGFVLALLVLELVMSLLGGSLFGAEMDAPDAELDLDIDAQLELGAAPAGFEPGEIEGGAIEGGQIEGGQIEGGQIEGGPIAGSEVDAASAGNAPAGILAWLGVGEAPLIIWIAAMLTSFGVVGYVIQALSEAIWGALLPAVPAALLALIPGVAFGARFARGFGRLIPKAQSSAIARRSLGGRRGVLVQGEARRGAPAQARVRDGYGEIHHLLVEPLRDDDAIAAGEDVIILRRRDGAFLALRLDDATAARS